MSVRLRGRHRRRRRGRTELHRRRLQPKTSRLSPPWATQQARSARWIRLPVVCQSLIRSRTRVRSVSTALARWSRLWMTTNSNSSMLVWAPRLSRASRRIEGSLESCKKIPTPDVHLLNSSQLHLRRSRRSESSRAMDLARLKIWLSQRGLVLKQTSNRQPTSRLVGKRRA